MWADTETSIGKYAEATLYGLFAYQVSAGVFIYLILITMSTLLNLLILFARL